MPIYEYKCRDCGAQFEKMRKISDAPLTVCEVCGGKLEKQISLSGFQFKGEGWYVTDYSSKKNDAGGKTGQDEKSGKTENAEKSEKTGKTEKNSTAESTAKSESASKVKSDNQAASKKD